MKWYAVPTVVTCGLNSMLAAIILSLATYHLFTNKSTNAPIELNNEWIRYVKFLLPFSACWMILSIGAMYVSLAKKQIIWATWITAFYAIALGVSIYFTLVFAKQLVVKDVEPDVLYQVANKAIRGQNQVAWIPAWLDNIQKQSKHCCGINTYHDYEKLWPNTPSRIPRSCCKDSKPSLGPCPKDLTLIPFPHTPNDYMKVEKGCTEEILASTRQRIRETFNIVVTMSIFICLALSANILLYVRRYLVKTEKHSGIPVETNEKPKAFRGAGDEIREVRHCDVEGANEHPIDSLNLTSSVALVDSMEGVQAFGSIVSLSCPMAEQFLLQQTSATMLAQIQQQQQLQTIQLEQIKQSQLLVQLQQQMPSLQHFPTQQMDPMVGGSQGNFVFNNNQARHEPFIAQSGTLPTASAPEQTAQTPRSVPPSETVKDSRSEPEPQPQTTQAQTSPPGSPGGRYKKVRREAIRKKEKEPK